MKDLLFSAVILVGLSPSAFCQQQPKPLVTGLKQPSAVAFGPGGRIFVTVLGEEKKKGQGAVMVIEKDKAVPFVTGLEHPMGIVAFQQWLFVAEEHQVVRIDAKGKASVFAAAAAFPTPPKTLGGITVDAESGTLYVCDLGDEKGKGYHAIYRISPRGKVDLVAGAKTLPEGTVFSSLAMDGQSHLLLTDAGGESILRYRIADKYTERVTDGLEWSYGIARDDFGRLYVSTAIGRKLFAIPRPGAKPVLLAQGFETAYGICVDPNGKRVLVADLDGDTLHEVAINIPGYEVDGTPLPLQTAVAFPDLKWTGWEPETKSGKPNPLRPLVLTHAGDESNRVFVATEQGVIHVFPNDQKATKTEVFLDITDRVSYRDDQNEEGFLGLCFHPRYKETGEFFVFYTPKKTKNTNVVSRFRVSKDDPNKADPASEEEIMRFTKPFWNHDGGTICFGPDGYLYVTHGDGGAANDPYDNGQNLSSLLGKIHRIDVDHKDEGKNYAIPKDNPFVGRKDAKPEIWAYGLRNVWRMAFDRKTGKLWAGDVGQNLWEEIDIIEKGGNYGWNRREGLHPFGAKGTGPKKEFIDPIWEYHHDVGKSITGGGIYRGPRLAELDGSYIYGDYVSMKIWALKYNESKARVVANRPIKDPAQPIFSFGEDEKGEMYMLCPATTGKGIYWFVKQ